MLTNFVHRWLVGMYLFLFFAGTPVVLKLVRPASARSIAIPNDIVAVPIWFPNGTQQLSMRAERLAAQLSRLQIDVLTPDIVCLVCSDSLSSKDKYAHYIKGALSLNLNVIRALEKCNSSDRMLCLVVEDDTEFHPDFDRILSEMLSLLPSTWTVFHLCPGFLWGRKYRDAGMHFQPNPEYPQPGFSRTAPHAADWSLSYSATDRYLTDWRGLVGGPLAFVVKKSSALHVASLISADIRYTEDESLTRLREPSHFVANNPQLCYESESGGNTWH